MLKKDDGIGNPWVVHNIGCGVQIEDILFEFPVTGHYRYGLKQPEGFAHEIVKAAGDSAFHGCGLDDQKCIRCCRRS